MRLIEICEAIVYHGRLDGDKPLIHILRDTMRQFVIQFGEDVR